MWRSIAARTRFVARNFRATQSPKVLSSSIISQSQLPLNSARVSLIYQKGRFLSSLGIDQNGDTQQEGIAPGNDNIEALDQSSLGIGENGDVQIESLTYGDGGTGEDGNLQLDSIDERNVISEGFSASFDDAQMETVGTDDSTEEVYQIDVEKLENLLSLLQSSVGDSLASSLDSMGLDLHQEFVVKVLGTPCVLGENLIGFFRWAMKKPGFKLTRPVVEALVHGVSTGLRKREVYALWDLIKEVGEKEDGLLSTEILNELIASLSKLGKGKAALEVFDKCGEFGCTPHAETYYFTIEALCKRSIIGSAWSVCEKMLDAGTMPDSEKVGRIISLLCKGDKAKEAHLVYLLAKEKNEDPPRTSVNFLISSLCRKDETVKLALEMLGDFSGEIQKYAIKPFASVIRGLCRMKNVDEARTLLLKMIEEGPAPGNAVFNMIISGYSKAGDMNKAKEMIKLMESRGLKPDVYSFTVVMSGYANAGQMEDACEVLSEAKKKHSKLSPITYHTLIRGYCKLEEYDKALKLLGEMKNFGVQANVDEYNKLIQSLCLKALDWRRAEKLLEEMKENGLHLSGITQGLIRAVKELEEEATGKLELSVEA